jgi:hypothetical protein
MRKKDKASAQDAAAGELEVDSEEARADTKRPPRGCTTGCDIGPQTPKGRADTAREVRVEAADFERGMAIAKHPCNGDEVRYQNRHFFASFTKGLPHDPKYGEVDPAAYCELLKALRTGKPRDFEKITLGCSMPMPAAAAGPGAAVAQYEQTSRFAPATGPAPAQRRLINPQSALAFDLEGADSHQLGIPPAPRFDSPQEAAEMVELYWQALARDIRFTEYGKEPVTKAAIKDLNQLGAAFTGPKDGSGKVTAQTLFRGFTAGDVMGPYISQFMLLDIPFGAQKIDPRINTVKAGIDYMTDFKKWLFVQNGCTPPEMDQIDPQMRYIRNGRDIGQYVHIDVLYQAYFNAMLILLTPKAGGGLGLRFDENNPYTLDNSKTQEGFGTFGGPAIAALIAEVATRALKAVWYQKWSVHRRLRPEAFGGCLHLDLTKVRDYPIDDSLRKSDAVKAVYDKYKTYLLPQAFPEGSPIHPAYGAGHATVAGACVTLLKAWFDESVKLKDLGVTPMVPKADGLALTPYTGPDKDNLTVGGELNKLAANIAVGRNHAGVHWRTDYEASVRLGEQVTIKLLEDTGFTYNENFKGFTLTTFDGKTIAGIGKKR